MNSENHLIRYGFALVRRAIAADERAELLTAIGPLDRAGRRGLLGLPVRAIFFNKSPDANWLVSWHQDLTIAVRERRDVSRFGPWTVKAGIPHVQPPIEVLERLLAVRLSFDDADESNGALRVLPATHRLGRLSAQQIDQLRSERSEVVCCANAGDALLMRPLLLHASARSTNERHRRVLHVEYAAESLPGGLEWHEAA